jgi:hypothetical protein
LDFEWKFREASRFEFWLEFDGVSFCDFKFEWNVDQGLLFAPSDQLNP